jgi:hypothetical protein
MANRLGGMDNRARWPSARAAKEEDTSLGIRHGYERYLLGLRERYTGLLTLFEYRTSLECTSLCLDTLVITPDLPAQEAEHPEFGVGSKTEPWPRPHKNNEEERKLDTLCSELDVFRVKTAEGRDLV